jgi:hypothetical protein
MCRAWRTSSSPPLWHRPGETVLIQDATAADWPAIWRFMEPISLHVMFRRL